MTPELRREIDKLKPQVIENARKIWEINETWPVTGTRHTLHLDGRDIGMVYYKAPSDDDPLFVAYHGGGFLFGGSAFDDELFSYMSRELNVNIATINYRQGPDHMDHTSLDDCYDSILYLIRHADEYNFNPEHISVMGASAGGNLAAAVALRSNNTKEFTLDNQILFYPFLDGDTAPDSKGSGSFSIAMSYIMNETHFSPDKTRDPYLSPIFATEDMLEGLPNVIIAYSENDNLKYEAIKYAEMLKEANVPTSVFFAKKMPHGYIESGFKSELTPVDRDFLGPDAALFDSGEMHESSVVTVNFIKEHML